jgi:hydroxypyruvate reductase
MALIDTTPHEYSVVRMEMLAVAEAALAAVQPEEAIQRATMRDDHSIRIGARRLVLSDYERAVIIGFGKAAVPMGRAALKLLEGINVSGVLVSPAPQDVDGLEVVAGSHPLPDERSLNGGRKVLKAARSVGEDDLAVVLISGGGSAVVAAPARGLTLADLQATNSLLLRAGATITELNAVRKHLSAVKGGRLAEALSDAKAIVTLVLSDVIGDPLDVVASGPTVPDPSTFLDALRALDKYDLRDEVPAAVKLHLEAGAALLIPDTPEHGKFFSRQIISIVADAGIAARAASDAARHHPGPAHVVATDLEGEAREVARELVEAAEKITPGETLVYAGETTVTVKGNGRGGRNQELALAASIALRGRDDVVILSMGTDGIDGMSQSAGAFADGSAVARGRKLGLDALDHLDRNDSHPYLAAIGDTVNSGPTGTNVGDLILVRRVS